MRQDLRFPSMQSPNQAAAGDRANQAARSRARPHSLGCSDWVTADQTLLWNGQRTTRNYPKDIVILAKAIFREDAVTLTMGTDNPSGSPRMTMVVDNSAVIQLDDRRLRAAEPRWPIAWTIILVIALSAGLWGTIIAGAHTLIGFLT